MEGTRQRLHPAVLTDAAKELAASVDIEATASRVTADIMVEVWSGQEDPEFREAMRRSVQGNVAAIYDVMLGRVDLEATRPRQALEFADLTAQLDVPVAELERAYRVGVASVWSQWLALATERSATHGVPLMEFVDGPSLTILGYVDHIMGAVVTRYDARRTELQRTRRQVRRLLVGRILDGTAEITRQLDEHLGYCLADTHVALLVHPADGTLPEDWALRPRGIADARAVLVHQHGPGSWIVWLGRPGGFGPAPLERLRRALATGPDAVAIGEPSAGPAGLRATHRQAVDTARVQRALGSERHRCLWAADVRLEALGLADEERARRFVAEELGALAGQGELAARLRETLLAWLASNSHVSAAAVLGVHENTIRNRIRQAEELLSAPPAARRTELQVALRLERVLRRPVPDDG